MVNVMFDGEFADSNALTRADFFIDAADLVSWSVWLLAAIRHSPRDTHTYCSADFERRWSHVLSPTHSH